MQALILAAGRGSRLGDVTAQRPKGLTPLLHKPLLQWQLDAITTAGITETSVATGYLAEQFAPFTVNKIHNPAWQESNMVRTLFCCDHYLQQQTTLVSYSDIVYSSATVSALQQAAGDIVLCYDPDWLNQWQQRFDNPLEDAETFDFIGNQLLQIGQKPQQLADIKGQYMGLFKLTTIGWSQLRDYLCNLDHTVLNKLDMTSLFSLLLSQGVQVQLCPVQGFWFEIDNQKDLALCEKNLTTQK